MFVIADVFKETAVTSDDSGYVLAAYLLFLLMVLVYIGILGAKFQRMNRDVGELADEIEAKNAAPEKNAPEDPVKESSGV
ncbi:MAG: hypothetical protein WBW62_05095 [Solirubrobacterales bacterium]